MTADASLSRTRGIHAPIVALWQCDLCKLAGENEHESPVDLDAVQSAAWGAHRILNAQCDDVMDLECFHITLHGPSIGEIAAEMAAQVDRRLDGAVSWERADEIRASLRAVAIPRTDDGGRDA